MAPPGTEASDPDLEALLRHVQESRGVDLRGSDRAELRREIVRRMEEVGATGFAAYHAFLEVHPGEYVHLLDGLVGGTSFFRDPEAWDAVREGVMPRLLARGSQIRVWSVGCASGEEPYSLAMLFADAIGQEQLGSRVRIYATDIDEEALGVARSAAYAPHKVEGVPRHLLEKYFERSGSDYILRRSLRKCVAFGRHDVVRDPPISSIDLLACRNLLIYFEATEQEQVLSRLHYALKGDGIVFLGKSETRIPLSDLFQPLDPTYRIFRRMPGAQVWRRAAGSSAGAQSEELRADGGSASRLQLLEALANATPLAQLVIGMDQRLVFANASARRMLGVTEDDLGRPFQDLSISYRPTELRSRIEEAGRSARSIRIEYQEHHPPLGEPIRVTIEVVPLFGGDASQFATLVSFADTTVSYTLQQELQAAQHSLETTFEELQSTNEELEATNEEMQSTNEELETTNEELQSTNEELESMIEELRSANDELQAVNEELGRQQEETAGYRRYAESLLHSVDMGIIVLDQGLRVRSWNRWAENVWGLRAEEILGTEFLDLDIGLPVQRLYQELMRVLAAEPFQAEMVLEARNRRGQAIQCRVRLAPLLHEARTPRGVVLVAEDVTGPMLEQEYARFLGRLAGQQPSEVYLLDPATLCFTLVSRSTEERLGFPMAQLRQTPITRLMRGTTRQSVHALLAPVLSGEAPEIAFEAMMRDRSGQGRPVEIRMRYFPQEQPPVLAAMVRDLSGEQPTRADHRAV